MRPRLFCLFLALLSFAAQASEAPKARPFYDENGAFGFCLADYVYDDGRKFTVALSPEEDINLGVTVPQAGFKAGAKYDLTLTPEKSAPQPVRATATASDTLLFRMGSAPAFAATLAAAAAIDLLAANGKTMRFATPDNAATLAALRACNAEHKSKTQTAPDLPEPLRQLLALAGFTTLKVLPLDHVPPAQRPADFVWQVGPVLGGVREREHSGDKTLAELSGLHIAGLKKKCDGAFTAAFDREQAASGLTLRTAQARCKRQTASGERTVSVALLFYQTAAGRFTVFTQECAAADEAEAIADRNALRDTLLKLAQSSLDKSARK